MTEPIKMPIPGDGMPRAAIVDRRIITASRLLCVTIACILIAGYIAFGSLLNRMDAARVDAHRAWAQTAVLRVELEVLGRHVRDLEQRPAAIADELCRRRTTALRSALFALVRTGTVAMPGDPGGDWMMW